MEHENSLIQKMTQVFVCIVLAAVLSGFLIWDQRAGAEENQRLRQIAEHQEAVQTETEERSLETISDAEAQELSAGESENMPESEPLSAPAEGISCWGDEFFRGEEAKLYSYRMTLQDLLSENGYDLSVADKTLSGASTLSMMKMAGVPQTDLDTYIEEHRQAAEGGEIPVTETGIRDLTAEQMERTEKDYIPVIFMGYYGGWNYDPQELIEQQQKILDTFSRQEQFLIVGCKPLRRMSDMTDYHAAMEEAWGEHYINASELGAVTETRDGQALIGQAVYEKLVELGYITKEQEE